ncbi:response regulator [Myxococcota bacterium]|nr:response regulator [Myxococcota bacterium]
MNYPSNYQDHIQFLENLNRIDNAIRKEISLHSTLIAVLDQILLILGCDRAWLLHPCDPNAKSWTVHAERTTPDYPGAYQTGSEQPMKDADRHNLQAVLNAHGPLCFSKDDLPTEDATAHKFSIQAIMLVAIYPKNGGAWALGVHHCAKNHIWTDQERAFFQEAGRRLGDGLNSLLLQRDLLERERELHQSQKMESIGQLASGVAHDFNNILTTILLNTDIAKFLFDDQTDKEFIEIISEIEKAGKNAASLINQLLTFAKKDILSPEILDVNLQIEDFKEIISRSVRENIKIEYNLGGNLPNILMDKSKLNQIILNLVINARDAIEKNNGNIIIKTSSCFIKSKGSSDNMPAVCLSVEDNGEGINPNLKDLIFDPFFTTKKKSHEYGSGSGLGLANIKRIVQEDMGGIIEVDSRLGHGSCFRVYLPIKSEYTHSRLTHIEIEQDLSLKDSLVGTEKIIVCEDEPSVLKMVSRLLKNAGYHVIEANDPLIALSFWRSDPIKADLLLTDLIMPAMNGRELLEEMRRDVPSLKSVFMSGYTSNILDQDNGHNMIENYKLIPKPFSQGQLLRAIRQILDQ